MALSVVGRRLNIKVTLFYRGFGHAGALPGRRLPGLPVTAFPSASPSAMTSKRSRLMCG